jgi:hypothetical protein
MCRVEAQIKFFPTQGNGLIPHLNSCMMKNDYQSIIGIGWEKRDANGKMQWKSMIS